MSRPLWLAIGLGLLLATWPLAYGENLHLVDLLFLTFIFVTQALAWNLLGGFAGQVSFGYASFFGVGAYTTALLWLSGWPPLATFPLAGVVAAIFALTVGLPCFRLVGPYFSIATIGVGEAMRVLALNLEPVTGGASGLNLPTAVPSKLWFYYVGLAMVSATFALAAWTLSERFGTALFAIRMDQDAAESLGVNAALYKNLAHCLGAFVVGVSGGVYATYFQYVHPDQVFGFEISIGMVLMPLIGGIATLWGPVLGGVLFYVLQDTLLTSFPSLHLLIYGVMLVLIILFEPVGLVGLIGRLARIVRRPPPAPGPAPAPV